MTEKALYDRRTRRRTPASGLLRQREHHRVALLGLARRIRNRTARVAPHRALHTQGRHRDLRASRSRDRNEATWRVASVHIYTRIPTLSLHPYLPRREFLLRSSFHLAPNSFYLPPAFGLSIAILSGSVSLGVKLQHWNIFLFLFPP